jgi:hypothetical protein
MNPRLVKVEEAAMEKALWYTVLTVMCALDFVDFKFEDFVMVIKLRLSIRLDFKRRSHA